MLALRGKSRGKCCLHRNMRYLLWNDSPRCSSIRRFYCLRFHTYPSSTFSWESFLSKVSTEEGARFWLLVMIAYRSSEMQRGSCDGDTARPDQASSEHPISFHFHYGSQNCLLKTQVQFLRHYFNHISQANVIRLSTTQTLSQPRCLWCNVECGGIKALLVHMTHSHPRAKYLYRVYCVRCTFNRN